jgi:hypothetical protein
VTQYRRWNIGPLGTGDRDLIRAQQNERIIVDRLWIANKDNSNQSVDIKHLPSDDGAAVDDFCLLHNHTINSKAYEVIESPIYMEPGDRIIVSASAANAIIVNAYGRIL